MGHARIPQNLKRKEGRGDERVSRVDFVFIVFALISLMLLVKLYRTQVMQHSMWEARAEEQRLATVDLKAERGEIFLHDADGPYPLAVNREYLLAYVSPKDVTEPEKVALELSQALSVDAGEILAKLSDRQDPFEVIKRKLSDDEVAHVRELKLKGVALMSEKYRYYPADTLASHIVGFSSLSERGGAGGYGIEASFDDVLRGFSSRVEQERDAGGRWIALSNTRGHGPNHGDNLILTIDRVIQQDRKSVV